MYIYDFATRHNITQKHKFKLQLILPSAASYLSDKLH